MEMPTGNGENPQFYGQWTIEDSQNGLCAKTLQRQSTISLDSRFVDLENSEERATLRWHVRLSAKVNKNANLGYSHHQVLS